MKHTWQCTGAVYTFSSINRITSNCIYTNIQMNDSSGNYFISILKSDFPNSDGFEKVKQDWINWVEWYFDNGITQHKKQQDNFDVL